MRPAPTHLIPVLIPVIIPVIVFVGLILFFSFGVRSQVYNLCEALSDEKVSRTDFNALITAMRNVECAEAWNVQPTFSLTKKDIEDLAVSMGFTDSAGRALLFFETGTPEALGVGALIVYGNDEKFVIKMGDRLHMWVGGRPESDLIVEVSMAGCDVYDGDCDEACSYERPVFDPECYKNEQEENVLCDIDAVDQNSMDDMITEEDLDGVCDLDCYNNRSEPYGAYDPDCIMNTLGDKDGVCDPDSLNHNDTLCDPDCAERNYRCDPDCDGLVDGGNPSGLKDDDCYVCDETCNGFCSPACEGSDYPDIDPDCKRMEQGVWCEGDNICDAEFGENCENSKDCPPEGSCEATGRGICCPLSPDSDKFGCTTTSGVTKGKECACTSQCAQSPEELNCNPTSAKFTEYDKACCPGARQWNGTHCVLSSDVLVVALKSNLERVYSASQIKQLENAVNEYISGLGASGLGGRLLYLDEDETSDIIGSKVTSPNSWSNIQGITKLLIPKLKAKYLVILGGYARFPQCDVGSHTGSDTPYGDYGGDGKYKLDIPVGRIPDPNNGDLAVMVNTLKNAAEMHKAGGLELVSHIAPIMACGGMDNRNWNSGKCFCQDTWGISCGNTCGCIGASGLNGKDFAMILAHGPGPSSSDFYMGGCLSVGPGFIKNTDVSDAMWMTMSCGGGHLKMKASTSGSMAMTFLKNGGLVYVGSTDLNYGGTGGCPVPGGDKCIGTLYTLVARRFAEGKRIGDAYMEGKNDYYSKYSCAAGANYHYYINNLYGDPTLTIKNLW